MSHHSHCGLHCLKIEHITVRASGQTLVEDVSLHAHCGEITALIGRNGAGKSTLFKAILDEIPHEGEVIFSGHNGTPSKQRPKIGYVPQSLNIDEGNPAAVLDIAVAYTSRWPAFLPIPRKLRQKLATHFARFDAADLLDKQAGRLSGGEWQRVTIARALCQEAGILLLDEPVSSLDIRHQIDALRLVRDLAHTDGVACACVLHDISLAAHFCDELCALHDGHIYAYGTPEEVVTPEMLRDVYSISAGVGMDTSGRPRVEPDYD